MKNICLLALIVFLIASAPAPETDIGVDTSGILSSDYELHFDQSGMQLYAARDGDNLCLKIRANTEGWVAIGVGSAVMDGSSMVIGYIEDGEPSVRVDVGAGHSHRISDENVFSKIEIQEVDGLTILEAAMPMPSENTLDIILAYGTADSFVSMHRARGSFTLNL